MSQTSPGLPELPDLARHLKQLVQQVPKRRVTSYGVLAQALGDYHAARWVGEWTLRHEHDSDCRCHRVVRATGEVGLYIAGTSEDKRNLLLAEGVSFTKQTVAVSARWQDFRPPGDVSLGQPEPRPPLIQLQDFQLELARLVQEDVPAVRPRVLCGLDVAYPRSGGAVAAAVLLDAGTLETIAERTLTRPVSFPYIPGFLAFRELPLLLELWETVRAEAGEEVLCMVDGNGRLHPLRAGIACCFGVLADVPTLGVSKSLLCGRVDRSWLAQGQVADIRGEDDELTGAVLPVEHSDRLLYVSVGHGISLDDAIEAVQRARTTHYLPEPTHRADRLSHRPIRQ